MLEMVAGQVQKMQYPKADYAEDPEYSGQYKHDVNADKLHQQTYREVSLPDPC